MMEQKASRALSLKQALHLVTNNHAAENAFSDSTEAGAMVFKASYKKLRPSSLPPGTVEASNFEPLFWLHAWNWCFRLFSMLLYEHIWVLNMQGLVTDLY